jgi:predicted lipoprotein with Yx(FWY)xxD motif/plastocyanin
MNTRLSLANTPSRVAFFGLIVLALALAGCSAPTASAPPTQAPAAPTAAAAAPAQEPAPTAAPAAPAPPAADKPASIALAKNDALGSFLVDDQGMTLYLFTKDTPNTSNCYDKCEQAWPPLFTKGAAKAGDGVDAALLGTTTRKDGSIQVTYSGWPLYYYVKDQKAGDVTGQNVGDVWFVVSAQGEMIDTRAAAPATGESSGQTAGQTATISVKNFAFNPKELTIKAGTTVIWHNNDSVTHTVTSDTGLFDGNLPGGADFQFTFDKAGTYPYYCKPHGGAGGEGMSGVITVS